MIDIRPARVDDRAEILRVAESSGLFSSDDIPFFAESFDGWSPNDPDEEAVWWIAGAGDGAAMAAPETMSDNVWNLRFIGVAARRQRQGIGSALLSHLERHVLAADGRMILIDTSDAADQEVARAFYAGRGYDVVGRVPDYYGEGLARITFARRL